MGENPSHAAGITLDITLDSLEKCVTNLYQNTDSRRETARYLTGLGYEECAEIANANGQDGGNIDADRVKNFLYQEVSNKCFAKRVDFPTNIADKDGLKELLCDSPPRRIKRKGIDSYFNIPDLVQYRCELRSPLDFITNRILSPKTSQTFLKKFIECQFQLKWATQQNGWPREFSYYDFCEVICQHWKQRNMRQTVLKNKVRSAQVKVQLYKHYISHTQHEFEVIDLCPIVYVRTGERQWQSLDTELKVALEGECVNNFDWISEPIRRYILSEAETIPEAELGDERLTKHTLYWAVVQDSNFQAGGKLKLNQIGRTQVYVGKANNGIKNRWLTGPNSHCHNMKKFLSVFRDVKTYNAELVSDVQLVDAVLLLEKLKGNTNSALFLMQTFDSTKELRKAERRNIVGKKMSSDHYNIIPRKALRLRSRWEPINMAYGMNVIK